MIRHLEHRTPKITYRMQYVANRRLDGMSLRAIGKDMGISPERVRQLLSKYGRIMNARLRASHARLYLTTYQPIEITEYNLPPSVACREERVRAYKLPPDPKELAKRAKDKERKAAKEAELARLEAIRKQLDARKAKRVYCRYPYPPSSGFDCLCHSRMGNDFWYLPYNRCLYEKPIPQAWRQPDPSTTPEDSKAPSTPEEEC